MAEPLISFTGRDYSAEFESLLTQLKAELPEYTDWNHSDMGIVILRLLARETDQLNFYIDQVFREGFIRSARFRQSLIELGLLVGYLPTLAAPAGTRLRLDREEGVVGDIVIPKYTAFKRSDGLSHLTVDAVTLLDGSDSIEVNAIQGVLLELDLEPGDFQVMDYSARPRASLGTGVVGNTCLVWEGDPAVYWTQVEWHWRTWPEDRHYYLELNGDDDTVWLVLGDGTQGRALPEDTLYVQFVRTSGAAGNCGHSTIYAVPDAFDGMITCTNIDPATGGAPAESRDSLRRMIPAVTRTQRRAVTLTDYEALLEYQPGVLHAQAIDASSNLWFFDPVEKRKRMPYEYTVLIVVPEGGGLMSDVLKHQLWSELGKWGHHGNWQGRYILLDAVEKPVNVAMRIGIAPNYTAEAVTSAVLTAVNDLMAPQNRTLGGTLTFTELHQTASAVAGVSWVEFDAPKEDVRSADGELIVLRSITATAV